MYISAAGKNTAIKLLEGNKEEMVEPDKSRSTTTTGKKVGNGEKEKRTVYTVGYNLNQVITIVSVHHDSKRSSS